MQPQSQALALLKGGEMRSGKFSAVCIAATVLFTGCGNSDETNKVGETEPSQQWPSVTDKYSEIEICKGVIAQVMGRDPSIISAQEHNSDVIALSYTRESDSSKWAYRCKLNGNTAVWASDTGRWRDDPADSEISVSLVESGKLSVKEVYGDGSSSESEFSKAQLSAN